MPSLLFFRRLCENQRFTKGVYYFPGAFVTVKNSVQSLFFHRRVAQVVVSAFRKDLVYDRRNRLYRTGKIIYTKRMVGIGRRL